MAAGEEWLVEGRTTDPVPCGIDSRDVDESGEGVVREREGVRILVRGSPDGLRILTLRYLSTGEAFS